MRLCRPSLCIYHLSVRDGHVLVVEISRTSLASHLPNPQYRTYLAEYIICKYIFTILSQDEDNTRRRQY